MLVMWDWGVVSRERMGVMRMGVLLHISISVHGIARRRWWWPDVLLARWTQDRVRTTPWRLVMRVL